MLEIAKKHIYGVNERGDLEQRYRDADDFLDVAVWCIRAALEEAYAAGKADAER